MEYPVKLDPGPHIGRVKGDAANVAVKAVELANLVGRTLIKYPHWVAGKQVVMTIRPGFNVDYVEQQVLNEASTIPGVYDEVFVRLSL